LIGVLATWLTDPAQVSAAEAVSAVFRG